MQQVSLDSPAGRSGPIYFSVSNRKLVLMNVFTLGFYQFHWFHQNWKVVERERANSTTPVFRHLFGNLWCYPLFWEIRNSAVRHQVKPFFSVIGATVLWLGLTLCTLILAPRGLMIFVSWIPLVYVQNTCNEVNRAVDPDHKMNDRFSALDIAGIAASGGYLAL